MQDIMDENSTIGQSCRTHTTEDDGLVTEGRSTVPSISKPSPFMETDVCTLTEADDVDSGIEDLWLMNEDGEYVDAIVRASLKLVSKAHSSEIQWHGLKLILHLLRFQWKEIDSTWLGDRLGILALSEKWAGHAIKLASKRSAAAFVAEIAGSNEVSLLKSLVPYLISLSGEGACEAELVCFILRSILSVGVTSATHLEAGKGEIVLHGLDEFLPQIWSLLCSLLEKHAEAAFVEQSDQHMELANQHECAVTAVLDAALAYIKWTPLCVLANLGIVRSCGSLFCSKKFSTRATQYLKSIWPRKGCVEYHVAVGLMFPVLMNVPENYLNSIEPKLHCLRALWPCLACPTNVHAKAVNEHFELLASVLEPCQDLSKPHNDRPLTCSAPMPRVVDNISSPSVSEDTSEEMGCLVEGYIFLSEAFISAASCPWIENYTELLSSILLPVSRIWSHLKVYHFCDSRFRLSVHDVTVFFEERVGIFQKEQSNCSSLKALLPPLLSLFLKMLQCVHSIWREDLDGVVESYCIMKGITDEDGLLKSIRECLLHICIFGYKVIGRCACLDAAFDELLDCAIVCDVLIKDIKSMDSQHVTWLIEYVIIPFVQNCPSKLWEKWIDSLLQPLCYYCDYILDESWCKILYSDMRKCTNLVHHCASRENCTKLRGDVFMVTREVSNLLAAVALPELNDGMTNESSLIRYVMYHDGLNASIRRLIRNIFGYWTDNEAKMKAVPFCYSLFSLASGAQSSNIVFCIKDDILPSIIKFLALQPCCKMNSNRAFKSSSYINIKSSSIMDHVLTHLCKDAYDCVQNQGGDGSSAETFECWFLKQIKVSQYKNSPVEELEAYVWIWEVEENFRDYLPTYTGVLYAVDKFVDGVKDDFFLCGCHESIDEFMSSADIDGSSDSVWWAVSSMLPRKISSVHWKRQNDQTFKFYCKLINFKPYIKYTGCDDNMQELIEKTSEEWPLVPEFRRNSAAMFFCRILELWEPQFHPLIREDHKDVLTAIAEQITSVEYTDYLQPFQAFSIDFMGKLQPYAQNYIDEMYKKAGYYRAREQAELHKKFDMCLASGEFDHYVRQKDFLTIIRKDKHFLEFGDLNCDLIKLSHERRNKLLIERDQLFLYFQQMNDLIVNDQLRNNLQSLISQLEVEGFFRVNDDSIEWGKKRFSDLVDEFEDHVFPRLNLPKYYVIRGIMDYWEIMHMEHACLRDAFKVVVGYACDEWMQNLHLFWMDTRYYKHDFYDTIQDPLTKVWKMEKTHGLESNCPSLVQ